MDWVVIEWFIMGFIIYVICLVIYRTIRRTYIIWSFIKDKLTPKEENKESK